LQKQYLLKKMALPMRSGCAVGLSVAEGIAMCAGIRRHPPGIEPEDAELLCAPLPWTGVSTIVAAGRQKGRVAK
jgi:hypothetical protein